MAATLHGKGDWGIDADETGIVVSDISATTQTDTQELRDRTGCVIGKAYYNATVQYTIDGAIDSDTPYAGSVASAMTLSNTLTSRLPNGVTAGKIIVESIDDKWGNSDYKKVSIKATMYPGISTT